MICWWSGGVASPLQWGGQVRPNETTGVATKGGNKHQSIENKMTQFPCLLSLLSSFIKVIDNIHYILLTLNTSANHLCYGHYLPQTPPRKQSHDSCSAPHTSLLHLSLQFLYFYYTTSFSTDESKPLFGWGFFLFFLADIFACYYSYSFYVSSLFAL